MATSGSNGSTSTCGLMNSNNDKRLTYQTNLITPIKLPACSSSSNTSLSSSTTATTGYSIMPTNSTIITHQYLTPPFQTQRNPQFFNNNSIYDQQQQQYIYNSTPLGDYIPSTDIYKNASSFFNETPTHSTTMLTTSLLNRSTTSLSSSFIEVSRMIPSSVSPSGSLSDTTEIENITNGTTSSSTTTGNNTSTTTMTLLQGSKSDYYITKKEKLIPTSTSKTNLYIRGLNENTTDKDLFDMCQKYGDIKSTKAIIDKQTLKCKGYGFVDFRSIDDAKSALADLKKEQKDVQLAKQREQDPTNLYFANLPPDIDEQCLANMLKTKFSANVSSTRVMRERTGVSKGVGFARIDDDKLCDNIIAELNNKPFPEHANKTKLILVKLADSGGILKPMSSKHHHHHYHHSSSFNRNNSQMNNSSSMNNNNNSNSSSSNFDKDTLNNTINSSSSNNALGICNSLNDSNNNNYATNNLNLNPSQQQQQQQQQMQYHQASPMQIPPGAHHPHAPPHSHHHPIPSGHYQYHMDPNYPNYPIIFDNYQSGATILSQHNTQMPQMMQPQYINHHRSNINIPPTVTPPNHNSIPPHPHQYMHHPHTHPHHHPHHPSASVIPHGTLTTTASPYHPHLAPQQAHFYPATSPVLAPANHQSVPNVSLQGSPMPYYIIQHGTNYTYPHHPQQHQQQQQQQAQLKQSNEPSSSTNLNNNTNSNTNTNNTSSSTLTPNLNQQFSNMSLQHQNQTTTSSNQTEHQN